MKPQSKLDRIRQELSIAEGKLASKLKASLNYKGVLYSDVKRLTEILAREERDALKAITRR